MSCAIRVEGLQKSYAGRAVLKGLTFTVEQGEIFALLGVNGAGKTTCLLYTSPSPRDRQKSRMPSSA